MKAPNWDWDNQAIELANFSNRGGTNADISTSPIFVHTVVDHSVLTAMQLVRLL